MQLASIEAIEPKEHVDPDDRTPGKDQAAEWIQDNVVEPDKWDEYTISQMDIGATIEQVEFYREQQIGKHDAIRRAVEDNL